MLDEEDVAEAHRCAERGRIADWLKAKSLETEELLKVAAARGPEEIRGAQLQFAIKTRVILEVIARMIETNTLPLAGDREPKS